MEKIFYQTRLYIGIKVAIETVISLASALGNHAFQTETLGTLVLLAITVYSLSLLFNELRRASEPAVKLFSNKIEVASLNPRFPSKKHIVFFSNIEHYQQVKSDFWSSLLLIRYKDLDGKMHDLLVRKYQISKFEELATLLEEKTYKLNISEPKMYNTSN